VCDGTFEVGLTTDIGGDNHFRFAACCGSAGSYSIIHPELSKQLRDSHFLAKSPLR